MMFAINSTSSSLNQSIPNEEKGRFVNNQESDNCTI